jgi:hypothetical protein
MDGMDRFAKTAIFLARSRWTGWLAHGDLLHGDRQPADRLHVLAIRFPETPRIGILRIETTRGDRLFITLLGSAFINIAWLGLTDPPSGGRWRSVPSMQFWSSDGSDGRRRPVRAAWPAPSNKTTCAIGRNKMHVSLRSTSALALVAGLMATPAFADMEAAMDFLDNEIAGLSVLTREEQEAEMQWFIDAAEPFQGMSINVVSETITTHEYEARCWPRPSPRSPASRSPMT